MKIRITESQYMMLMEEQKVLHIPSMKILDNNFWEVYNDENLLNERVSNFEKQKGLVENLLSRFEFENVCGFDIVQDEDLDRIGTVFVIFSGSFKYIYVNKVKSRVRAIINNYLGLDNIYVGSYQVKECR
jgi:hypothetical protein